MIHSLKRLASLAVLFTVATACAGPSNLPQQARVAPQIQAQQAQNTRAHLFKVQQGFEWVYDTKIAKVMDPQDEHLFKTTLRTEKVVQDGADTVLELRYDDVFSANYVFPSLRLTPRGALVENATFIGSGADYPQGLQLDFLHMPLNAGERWEEENWLAKVRGTEKVTVPAGTFDAIRVEVIGTYQQAYTNVGDYWIVPGLGIVQARYTVPDWHVEMKLGTTGVRQQAAPRTQRPLLRKGQPRPVTSKPVIR